MQPGATRVFLDANILYSRTLRDWFCLLSQESGFDGIELFWSEDVLAEMIYHLRKKNPHLSDEQVGGWRRTLLKGFPDAIITGYSIDPSSWLVTPAMPMSLPPLKRAQWTTWSPATSRTSQPTQTSWISKFTTLTRSFVLSPNVVLPRHMQQRSGNLNTGK